MASRSLVSEWRLPGTVEEVVDVLGDAEALTDWWGDVYLSVETLKDGDENGVGRVVAFHSRGKLPYTLRWCGEVISVQDDGWTIRARGDLEGQGVWTFAQEGDVAVARYVWTVDVERPWMRIMAPILWPVFIANHEWAMARGEEGLRRELVRRRNG